MELLFVPLPDGVRARAKPIIDVVGQRGGQAVASLLILAEVSQNRGNGVLAAAAAALCILWVAWASELRRHYLDLFRAALREGSMRARVGMQAFDLGSLEAVFAGLNSRNDLEVLGAMDILADEGRVRLIPALILFHPSREVVLHALDHFARSGRTDFVPVADRLLNHADEDIRAAAVRARTAGQRDEGVLRAAAKDPSPLVQATALVGLVAGGWVTDEAQAAVDSLLASPAPEARRALARALRQQPVAAFDDLLEQLAETGDHGVQRDVAHALGSPGATRSSCPSSCPCSRPATCARRRARRWSSTATRASCSWPRPWPTRRCPTSCAATCRAASAASRRWTPCPRWSAACSTSRTGWCATRSCAGWGAWPPRTPTFPSTPPWSRKRRASPSKPRSASWIGASRSPAAPWKTPGAPPPATSSWPPSSATRKCTPWSACSASWASVTAARTSRRSTAGCAARARRCARAAASCSRTSSTRRCAAPVMGIVDDVPDAERLTHAAAFYVPESLDYERLLFKLLDQQGETVRCIAAYHVGELGLTEFRERLESFQRAPTGLFVQRVIERALALLTPPGERLQYAR